MAQTHALNCNLIVLFRCKCVSLRVESTLPVAMKERQGLMAREGILCPWRSNTCLALTLYPV